MCTPWRSLGLVTRASGPRAQCWVGFPRECSVDGPETGPQTGPGALAKCRMWTRFGEDLGATLTRVEVHLKSYFWCPTGFSVGMPEGRGRELINELWFPPETTKPYKFIRFGAMDVTKPYKFIGFGTMDATKPYEFIGFGTSIITSTSGPLPGFRGWPLLP